MNSLRIGILLGFRQIQRANRWTNILIIFVMMLTFLNLIAVSGILVGLIAGSERAVKEKSLGDIIITPLTNESQLIQTETIRNTLNTIDEIMAFSIRYQAGGTAEANYTTRRDQQQKANIVSVPLLGINPTDEDLVTKLSENVVEGEYLDDTESGYVLVGALTIDRYTSGFADITDSLENVYPGDTIKITANGSTKEFIIKGIVNAKAGSVSKQVYLPETELRRLTNQVDRNGSEIAIRLKESDPNLALAVKKSLLTQHIDEYAKIRTFSEALPKFITDMKNTFSILSTFIGAIGIVVASITIFIIIFINAISRRRQIGILKGIGIDAHAIEIAYVLQAAFYALVGSFLGVLVTYMFLVGYFEKNPIDFPFSDGILVAEPFGTFIRFITLFIVTLIAGFIPAWIIVRKNTLDSILGRK